VVAGVADTAHLYAFGAVKTKVTIVHADRSTPGFMRSPPMVPYMYALETAMDELAVKLGMDPDRATARQRHNDGADRRQAVFKPVIDEVLRPGC
jgi:CO/xanthine dehydrogenase Mo-binding subunit